MDLPKITHSPLLANDGPSADEPLAHLELAINLGIINKKEAGFE